MYIDIITTIVSFITLIFVFRNWRNAKKQQEPVKIVLKFKDRDVTLPIELIRKNFTRAEVFGLIRVFDKDHQFHIEYTSTKEFFEQLLEVQEGKKDTFSILIGKDDKFIISSLKG